MAPSRDRDVVQALRAELAAIDPPRACCRAAERAGLGEAARGRARSPVVARLVVRLADAVAATDDAADTFDWASARAHCRSAWLRGRFLSTGSLSLGIHGAHLELVVPPEEADELAHHLEDAGFPPSRRLRRGRVVLTWKRTEKILAFLRSCGAGASLLEVESRLVMRQLQGHLNRVINAENANLERSVASSARQLATIEQLDAEGRLADLAPTERAVADERRAAPEATFSELAARLGYSRARVQRAFERLESRAERPSAAAPAADL
jgi:DNA-binding protein WhiA